MTARTTIPVCGSQSMVPFGARTILFGLRVRGLVSNERTKHAQRQFCNRVLLRTLRCIVRHRLPGERSVSPPLRIASELASSPTTQVRGSAIRASWMCPSSKQR